MRSNKTEFQIVNILNESTSVLFSAMSMSVNLVVKVNSVSPVVGDVSKIKRVVMNLLNNAFKFTDKGAVTISVTGREPLLEVEVEDTGIGITEASIGKLFTPYSQVHTEREAGGTGLGLNIARSMCESEGGTLSCKSVFGKGSTFTATFSVTECDNSEEIVYDNTGNMDNTDDTEI